MKHHRRRYIGGDDEGLNGLMERYDNSLTFYINGYIHDLHESEDLNDMCPGFWVHIKNLTIEGRYKIAQNTK